MVGRQDQFRGWLERDQPDVICLQEMKAGMSDLVAGLHTHLNDNYWHDWSRDVAVLLSRATFRKKGKPQFHRLSPDHTLGYLAYGAGIAYAITANIVIASIYFPKGGVDFGLKQRFMDQKLRFIDSIRQHVEDKHANASGVILCGNLNVARAEEDVHPRDRKLREGQRPDERRCFEHLLSADLVDVCRTLNPGNDRLFTWWALGHTNRERNIGWRLDYILASQALAEKAVDCSVLTDVGTSDHAPVMATFDL